MSQNIYDDPNFYANYQGLDRQVHGLDYAPEWKVLQTLIPDLKGANVLDLGCGSGWVCRWAREKGAATALGIDVSETMLAKVKEFPEDHAITYERRDLEDDLQLSATSFDFAFSSLAFHYVANFQELISQVYRSLKPGGVFVFDVLHPIRSAEPDARWVEHLEGQGKWPVDNYLVEGPRVIEWLSFPVRFRHRTIATYFTILLQTGFTLAAFHEWSPEPDWLKEFPFWSKSGNCPMFMIFKFVKPKV